MADDANDAPFSIAEEGEDSGILWVGDFRAKIRLTLRDQLQRDKIRRELLGDMGGTPDPRAFSIAALVAECSVRLTKFPDWWTAKGSGLDLEDGNILGKIYDGASLIETKAREERAKKAEEARKKLKEIADKKVAEDK